MNKTVVITGAGGVLCSIIAEDFAKRGDKVALLDINENAVNEVAKAIVGKGYVAKGYKANVLDKDDLNKAYEKIKADFGTCDLLINGAGGNSPKATTTNELHCEAVDGGTSFFDLDKAGVDFVFNLNFMGTFLVTQVFAKDMANNGKGNIINISSMNAFSPLTKIPAYSGAKAAISNFTQWLAVHFAKSGIRVNAIAPGFFVTNQNRTLLYNADGTLSKRSEKILRNTPMERFGEAEELLGTLEWLSDDTKSSFVTGIVVPIDGGFSAYSGV
ncbi:MAG: SDR family oxidoreductase [Clostridia bacterium]